MKDFAAIVLVVLIGIAAYCGLDALTRPRAIDAAAIDSPSLDDLGADITVTLKQLPGVVDVQRTGPQKAKQT